MGFELREGQGTLFRNDKDGNDKRPDYRGEMRLPNGEVVKLAAWVKEGRKGKFLSISIDKPREQNQGSFPGGGSGGISGGGGNGNRQEQGRSDNRSSSFDDPFGDSVPF